MPANPDKTPCQHPGCCNWAMRGRTPGLCRVHSGLPNPGGAPVGNLNAVKTAARAHLLDTSSLRAIARQIANDPAGLSDQLLALVCGLHHRATDPIKTLRVFRKALADLAPWVTGELLLLEVASALDELPPQDQRYYRRGLPRLLARGSLEQMLIGVREWRALCATQSAATTAEPPSAVARTR